jgi:hypothetical protein
MHSNPSTDHRAAGIIGRAPYGADHLVPEEQRLLDD